jgi:hypothetical protein
MVTPARAEAHPYQDELIRLQRNLVFSILIYFGYPARLSF